MKYKIKDAENDDSVELGRVFALHIFCGDEGLVTAEAKIRPLVLSILDGKKQMTIVSPTHFKSLCALMTDQIQSCDTVIELPEITVCDSHSLNTEKATSDEFLN